MKKIVGISAILLLSFIGYISSSHAAEKKINSFYELYTSTSTSAEHKRILKHFSDKKARIEKIRNSSRVARQRALATSADPAFKLGKVYAYPNPAVGVKHPVIHIEAGLADKAEIKIYDNTGKLVEETVLTEPPKIVKGVYAYEYRFASDNTPYGASSYSVRVFKSGFEPLDASGKIMFINLGFGR